MTNSKLLKLAALALVSAATFTTQAAFADGLSCSDWSFNNSGCAAYLKPTEKKAEAIVTASAGGTVCSDWSFNDSGCSAYIRR